MQLRFTVVDPARLSASAPGELDCSVYALPGATLADVSGELLAAVGRRSGRLVCGGAVTPLDHPLGTPPLVQGAVLTVDGSDVPQQRCLLELHVTAGPDAGGVHPLIHGAHTLGRSAVADVRVDDPELSRLHARLAVGHDTVVVEDLGSTNGSAIDGTAVSRDGTLLAPGQSLSVGASQLRLVIADGVRAATRADGMGHLEVNRPPRLTSPPPRVCLQRPTPPLPREGARFPFLAAAVPAVAGAALVAFTGSTSYLFFVLLSPLMVLGTFISDRVGGRRSNRTQRRKYDADVAALATKIAGTIEGQTRSRHRMHPDAATVFRTADGPAPRLWERRPADDDFLHVRVGLGEVPAAIDFSTSPGHDDEPAVPVLKQVPVTVDLGALGVTGLTGPRARVLAVARHCLAQLATCHSPRHLGLVLLLGDTAATDDWRWIRWLPHLRESATTGELLVGLRPPQVTARVAYLSALLDSRLVDQSRAAQRKAARAIVVVLDGAHALRREPGVARLIEQGPAVGINFLCLEVEARALPAECHASLAVTGDVGTRLCVTSATHESVEVVADAVGAAWAERLARCLAPLRDATPEEADAQLAPSARLLDLLPFDPRASPRSSSVG